MDSNSKNILFIITSLVKVKDNYVSAFTTDERYKQTLNTIHSIRSRLPYAEIVVVEASHSNTPVVFEDVIMYYVDNAILGESKSIGEATILKTFTSSLLYKNLTCEKNHLVFKISGRYFLDENFDIKKFDENKINCRLIDTKNDPNDSHYNVNYISANPDICSVTSFFAFPSNMTEYFRGRMQFVIDSILRFGSDIEHHIFRNVPVEMINNIDLIGISGFITSGRFLIY